MIGRRKSALSAVKDLLATQKAALLSGDLEGLAQIEAPLGQAFDRLKADHASRAELAIIKASAHRNAALLKAAQSGLETARAQITARGPGGLTTYDAQGQSQKTNAGASRLLARR